jgi:hypoxanthine phosphoribosyltransferase
MSIIQVRDKKFKIYISANEIQEQVKRIGKELNNDYEGKCPLFIVILNGSFMFAADLFKELTIDAEISFVKLASYQGTKSTGQVVTLIGLDQNITGRDVVIIEDIVDTGKTMHEFLPNLNNLSPKSVKVVTLLHKPDALEHPVKLDYIGFNVPNKFLLGYGLDYDGIARNLKEIYQLTD